MEHFLFLTLILTFINSILGQDNSTDPVCYLTGYPKFDVKNINLIYYLAFSFFNKMLQIQSRCLLHFGPR